MSSHSRHKIETADIVRRIAWGQLFLVQRPQLTDSAWHDYLDSMNISLDSAQTCMRLARRFGDRPDWISCVIDLALPFRIVEHLSSHGVSDETIDQFLMQAHRNITIEQSRELLRKITQPARSVAQMELPIESSAIGVDTYETVLLEHRKSVDALRDMLARCEQTIEQFHTLMHEVMRSLQDITINRL